MKYLSIVLNLIGWNIVMYSMFLAIYSLEQIEYLIEIGLILVVLSIIPLFLQRTLLDEYKGKMISKRMTVVHKIFSSSCLFVFAYMSFISLFFGSVTRGEFLLIILLIIFYLIFARFNLNLVLIKKNEETYYISNLKEVETIEASSNRLKRYCFIFAQLNVNGRKFYTFVGLSSPR